jgi:hypothetical protein
MSQERISYKQFFSKVLEGKRSGKKRVIGLRRTLFKNRAKKNNAKVEGRFPSS